MAEKKEPVLNELDRNSATWSKVKKYCEARIAALRARNDNDLDEQKTSRIRGSISELKHLMTLGDQQPKPPPEDQFKD